ncbi:hypothetical protein ACEQPO_28680 [Bacillus sp. SL00103]
MTVSLYQAAVSAVRGAGYELLINDENAFRRFMKEEVEQEEPLAVCRRNAFGLF